MPFRKDVKIDLLRRTPLFSKCSKRELAAIAAIADEIRIPAGEDFIREGERGREFFALVDGTVSIRRSGRRVHKKGGAEFFGEIALLTETPRNATVTATSPVRAFVITQPAFKSLMRDSPQLQLKVLQSLAERLAPDAGV